MSWGRREALHNMVPRKWLDLHEKKNSQMPRHLISDAHEWINEIPTVPIYGHVNQQARERTCTYAAGKEDPVELDSSLNLYGDIGSAE